MEQTYAGVGQESQPPLQNWQPFVAYSQLIREPTLLATALHHKLLMQCMDGEASSRVSTFMRHA